MFPLMEGKAFEALVEDIKAQGVRVPVMLFKGKILDGRNRYRAAVKLGAVFSIIRFKGSEQAARDYVISANIHRRHLTNEQKRALIEKLLKADPEKSDRQIAKEAKLSDHKRVGRGAEAIGGTWGIAPRRQAEGLQGAQPAGLETKTRDVEVGRAGPGRAQEAKRIHRRRAARGSRNRAPGRCD